MPQHKPTKHEKSFAELIAESARLQEASRDLSSRIDQLAKHLKERLEEFERQEVRRLKKKQNGQDLTSL